MKATRGGETVDIRKIWGGFCWPGDNYGYCCAIGEGLVPQMDERFGYIHHLYFLGEFVGKRRDRTELLDAAIEMEERFHIERWYGRGFHDKENTRFLNDWNRNVKARSDRRFRIRAAYQAETDSIGYHVSVLSTALRPGSKILYWLSDAKVTEEHISCKDAKRSELTCDKFPALAACGYAVTMLRALKQEAPPMFG